MSDTKTDGVSNKLFPKVRDAAILKEAALFLGWIAGLIIIAGLCWSLSGPARSRLLLTAANRALTQSGDSRRLAAPASPPAFSEAGGSFASGVWFTMNNGNKAFVFAFISDGTFFPCAAVMSQDGKVEEFIPLNSHGSRTIKTLPSGVFKINARRIEGAKI